MRQKLIFIMVFLMAVSTVSAAFNTMVELDIASLTGISQLDNSNGYDVNVTIKTAGGSTVVSRSAAAGIYKPDMSITMTGSQFSLDYATDYTYILETVYGDFEYNFTTQDEPSAGGLQINSIQAFEVSIDSGKNATATINAVDPSKSMIVMNGMDAWEGTIHNRNAYLQLLNSTTILAHREGGSSWHKTRGQIIEFSSGVKSVQRGVIYAPGYSVWGGPETIYTTINEVNTSNSIINYCGRATIYHSMGDTPVMKLSFYNSTTLKAYRGAQGGTRGWFSYEIIEFE